ncbi:MAG: hypothetical protein ACJA08_000300 [Cyclobacteriaceae bacterium]|jgi:hypothetical protein
MLKMNVRTEHYQKSPFNGASAIASDLTLVAKTSNTLTLKRNANGKLDRRIMSITNTNFFIGFHI